MTMSKSTYSAAKMAQRKAGLFDRIIGCLKNELEAKNETHLPSDPDVLRATHERLIHRHRIYATDDMVADELLHLLEKEIEHKEEAKVLIASLEGDPKTFAGCQDLTNAIAKVLDEKGSCTPEDIINKGFDTKTVWRRWKMAYALAEVSRMEN